MDALRLRSWRSSDGILTVLSGGDCFAKRSLRGSSFAGDRRGFSQRLQNVGDEETTVAFDNLIWPRLDTHIWPHLY